MTNPGFTRLQASTDSACMGENITFSCTTSNSFLIWEVIFADRTVRSIRYLFQLSDTPGRINFESNRDVHLYFQLVSNKNGILESILGLRLIKHTSASRESAVTAVECDGTETRRLTFGLACKFLMINYRYYFMI